MLHPSAGVALLCLDSWQFMTLHNGKVRANKKDPPKKWSKSCDKKREEMSSRFAYIQLSCLKFIQLANNFIWRKKTPKVFHVVQLESWYTDLKFEKQQQQKLKLDQEFFQSHHSSGFFAVPLLGTNISHQTSLFSRWFSKLPVWWVPICFLVPWRV